jgi:hypothetical protein
MRKTAARDWQAVWKSQHTPEDFHVIYKKAGLLTKNERLAGFDFKRIREKLDACVNCRGVADRLNQTSEELSYCFRFSCERDGNHDEVLGTGVDLHETFR